MPARGSKKLYEWTCARCGRSFWLTAADTDTHVAESGISPRCPAGCSEANFKPTINLGGSGTWSPTRT